MKTIFSREEINQAAYAANLTVVGDGPEKLIYEAQTDDLQAFVSVLLTSEEPEGMRKREGLIAQAEQDLESMAKNLVALIGNNLTAIAEAKDEMTPSAYEQAIVTAQFDLSTLDNVVKRARHLLQKN